MSWNAPKTWTAGYTVLAVDLNQQIRDNMNLLVVSLVDSSTGKLQAIPTSVASLKGLCQIISFSSTAAANSGSGETTLQTYSMPGGTLANAGDALRMTSWGTTTNSGNAKNIRQYFGATQLSGSTALPSTTTWHWWLQSVIARITNTTQTALNMQRAQDSVGGGNNFKGGSFAPTETLSGTVVVKTTGQGGASSEISCKGQIVEILRAP